MKSIMKKVLIGMLAAVTVFAGACGIKGGTVNENETDADIKSITIFKNDWPQFNTAKQAGSPVYTAIKEYLGCDINGENGSSATYFTQLKLRQTDMDLPEIFLVDGLSSPAMLMSLIEEGDIVPLSDYVTQEKYPNLYRHLQQYDYMKKNVSYFEGKQWIMPIKWENEKSMYVRQDWIDNLNAKLDSILVADGIVSSASEVTPALREQWKFGAPTTLLEFYRLARAFTIYDPDNNGSDDTVGYMSESNKDMDAWVFTAFGTGWHQFVPDGNGQYTASDITDAAKLAVGFLNRLIADKYMSVDSLTADMDSKQSRFSQGKAGIIYAHNWLNNLVSDIMSTEQISLSAATAKILMCDPPAGPSGTFGGVGENGFWRAYCVNKRMSTARINKCLKLFDYLMSDEGLEIVSYGIKDVHYSVEDGKKVPLTPTDAQGMRTDVKYHDGGAFLQQMVTWTAQYHDETQINADIIVPRQERSAENRYWEDYPNIQTSAYIRNYESCTDFFTTTMADMMLDSRGIYNNLSAWTYNAATFGWNKLTQVSNNFNSAWNTFVRKYKEDYRGGAMITEYNKYIADGKAQKVNNI